MSRIAVLSSISLVALVACATPQENPYYKYSSKYKGSPTTSVAQAPTIIQSAPVSYESTHHQETRQASYVLENHECLKKEQNYELVGAGIGGTIGAIAGKELIGGTKGAVIGAGLGGAAGYGVGDKVVNCDPQPMPVQQITAPSSPTYTASPAVTASYEAPAASTVTSQPNASPTDTEFSSISEIGTPGYQVLQAQSADTYGVSVDTDSTALTAISGAQQVSYDYGANTIQASAASIPQSYDTRVIGGDGFGAYIVKQGDTVYSLSRKLCTGITEIQSLNNLDASYGINIGESLQLPSSRC